MKRYALAPFVVCLSACVVELDQEQIDIPVEELPPPQVSDKPLATVVEECEYDFLAHNYTTSTSLAISLVFAEGTQWVFAHTPTGNGVVESRSSTTATTPVTWPGCGHDFSHVFDQVGNPARFLVLSRAEDAFNREHGADGLLIALYPVSGFVAPSGLGYVFYRKVLHNEVGEELALGVGVAEVSFGGLGKRLARASGEPALLWEARHAYMGSTALLHSDGLAYVFGCYDDYYGRKPCVVGRVDPARVGDADAYRYYDGASWVDDIYQAEAINTYEYVFPAYVPAIDRYASFAEYPGDFAAEPWGPFAEGDAPLFSPSSAMVQVRLHPGNDASMLLLSDVTGSGPDSHSVRFTVLRIE